MNEMIFKYISAVACFWLLLLIGIAIGMGGKEDLIQKDIEQSGIIQINNKFYQVMELEK